MEDVMFLRISWGALKPGTWEEYEATHQRVVPGVGEVEGLRGRIVARDVDRPDTGYSISLWDSLAAMQTYEEGPLAAARKSRPRTCAPRVASPGASCRRNLKGGADPRLLATRHW